MNPLFNPLIGIPFLKNYIFDPGRLKRLNPHQLERYRNRAFRKIIKYAYNVPLYHKKFRESGLKPTDIKGINDIKKIPFVSKQDLRDNFPENIIPKNYDKSKSFVVSTGGTTGKPVSIYTDFPTWLRALGPWFVEMKYFKLDLGKSKVVHIGNFNRYRIDGVVQNHFLPHFKYFYTMDKTLNIDVNEPIKSILERLNDFKPDLIISYPAIFQHLAFLKRKGFGKNVNPKLLHVGGAILDDYTRSYVEDTFNCRLLNIYPSVEAQSSIAFECFENNWHVHTDFFHLEAVDDNMNLVEPGKRGKIVITRLWGYGTPIIRYIGMDDWITLGNGKTCSCGLNSLIFDKPIEGRMRANIVLPNGKIFPPGAFCFISPVLHDLKTYKVKRFQIVQRKIDEIEILLEIDDDLRDIGASIEEIADNIIKIYTKKTGSDVSIKVKEVKEIKNDSKSGKPAPIVVSHVKLEEGFKTLEQ
jgi:phenylacetate-CoA ligase